MNGIRDWANEGATPEELALLAASRSERPPAAARSQTLAALGLGTTIAATMTTTTSAAATTAGSTLGVVAKLAVVLVVAGGAAGGVVWHETHEAEKVVSAKPPRTAPVPVVLPPGSAGVAAEPAPNAAPATEEASPRAVRAAPGASGKPRPAASSDTLSLEVAALEKAHAALAAHDPDAALRALDRYRARFPGGALSSEETVLRVQAAVARGDKRNAAALADKLRADHPDSPYVKRVGDLVSDEKAAKH